VRANSVRTANVEPSLRQGRGGTFGCWGAGAEASVGAISWSCPSPEVSRRRDGGILGAALWASAFKGVQATPGGHMPRARAQKGYHNAPRKLRIHTVALQRGGVTDRPPSLADPQIAAAAVRNAKRQLGLLSHWGRGALKLVLAPTHYCA